MSLFRGENSFQEQILFLKNGPRFRSNGGGVGGRMGRGRGGGGEVEGQGSNFASFGNIEENKQAD